MKIGDAWVTSLAGQRARVDIVSGYELNAESLRRQVAALLVEGEVLGGVMGPDGFMRLAKMSHAIMAVDGGPDGLVVEVRCLDTPMGRTISNMVDIAKSNGTGLVMYPVGLGHIIQDGSVGDYQWKNFYFDMLPLESRKLSRIDPPDFLKKEG